ncbi:AKH_1a_G0030150.mRNA.1.CDS.1 [Saccharomyces cerevisiae]|nr:AKH_1a_G0030150.mRNA.1.CDS.1 [Saccharomyces cerevisiae]CAI6747430.1 AKH_1a_G0030150.mRNA.1.CDS.1 [Saccharomyces cerevisiae]
MRWGVILLYAISRPYATRRTGSHIHPRDSRYIAANQRRPPSACRVGPSPAKQRKDIPIFELLDTTLIKNALFALTSFLYYRTNILTCPFLNFLYLSRTGQLDKFCKDQTVTQILAT